MARRGGAAGGGRRVARWATMRGELYIWGNHDGDWWCGLCAHDAAAVTYLYYIYYIIDAYCVVGGISFICIMILQAHIVLGGVLWVQVLDWLVM